MLHLSAGRDTQRHFAFVAGVVAPLFQMVIHSRGVCTLLVFATGEGEGLDLSVEIPYIHGDHRPPLGNDASVS